MIEQAVKKILALQKESRDCEDKVTKAQEEVIKAREEHGKVLRQKRTALWEVCRVQDELGKLIVPLQKNIVVEAGGKQYCVYYNKKYETAVITEMISAKEAEVRLSINKLEGATKSNG